MGKNIVNDGFKHKAVSFVLILCLVLTIPMFGDGQEVNAVDDVAVIDMSNASSDVIISKVGEYITVSGVGFESGSDTSPTSLVITGRTTDAGVFIDGGAATGKGYGFDITLSGADIDRSSNGKYGMRLLSGAGVSLTLQGDNYFVAGDGWAGLEVSAPCSIEIKGDGKLTTTGGNYGAGVGGGDDETGDNITIAGSATVIANGGSEAAGIGGGAGGEGSNITISGDAEVTATGGDPNGAGIGGGGQSGGGGGGRDGSDIRILGNAKVTARGGGSAAGIGGGSDKDGRNITISDNAEVIATGGSGGAGIGGGFKGTGRSITISNYASVTATGGQNAAGIGGGYCGNANGIEISGGIVSAIGGDGVLSGAGIGGGHNEYRNVGNGGAGNDIIISGGFVTATGNGDQDDIGGSTTTASSVIINGGSVFATGDKIARRSDSTLTDGKGHSVYKVTVPAIQNLENVPLYGGLNVSVPLSPNGVYNARTIANGSISEHGSTFPADAAAAYIYLPTGDYKNIDVGQFGSGYANVKAAPSSASDNIIYWAKEEPKPEPVIESNNKNSGANDGNTNGGKDDAAATSDSAMPILWILLALAFAVILAVAYRKKV